MAKTSDAEKSFDYHTVVVLCCAILRNGGSIGMKEYSMMSAIDGEKTASSYEHRFRAIIKKAREMKEELDKNGDQAPAAVQPKPAKGRKGGNKRKAANLLEEDSADAGAEDEGLKRVKAEPKVKSEPQDLLEFDGP